MKYMFLILTFLFSGCVHNFNYRPENTDPTVFKYYYVTERTFNFCDKSCFIEPFNNDEREKCKESYKYYEKKCNVKFIEVTSSCEADIIIGHHGFKGRTAGHATPGFIYIFPLFKKYFIHMKTNYQPWLYEGVFRHELGHVLGLNHNKNTKSLMYEDQMYKELDPWDIYILVEKYGPPNL